MPYTGADDPKLPANVKRLSVEGRKKWIATWNSVFHESGDESKAFRIANGTITAKEGIISWSQDPWDMSRFTQ